MSDPKVIAYIATSLDGFVARKNHDISWLEKFNDPEDDYGWDEFISNIGTVIMGARTWEQTIQHPERYLPNVRNIVLSKKVSEPTENLEVEYHSGDIVQLTNDIKSTSDKNIFIMGGGKVVSSFLNAGLIDELWHFVAPVIIGEGLPLYTSLDDDLDLSLIDSTSYNSGIVRLRYLPETS